MVRKAKVKSVPEKKVKNEINSKPNIDEQIAGNLLEIEHEKEKLLLNLIVEVIVNATLRDLYETSDSVFTF